MTDFLPLLRKHFRMRPLKGDNLPHLCTPPRRNAGREALAEVLHDMGVEWGVEVGVRFGRSALVWLDACPALHLTCVDPWLGGHEKNYSLAVENLKGRNAEVVRATSMEAVSRFKDGTLDFVHIDGNHEYDYAAPDIIFWSQKLKSGGVMAVHDYLEFHRSGVVEAVKSYTSCHHIDPWFVTRDRLPTAFWQKP